MVKRNIRDLLGATAHDVNGDKLGDVKEVYVDDRTGQPKFVEVAHGLFGMSSSLVPLRGHHFDGETVALAFSKDKIKDAPDVEADAALNPAEEQQIFTHYGVDTVIDEEDYEAAAQARVEADRRAAGNAHAGVDAHAGATDEDALIRSEERLNVSKENVAAETARLRKYVVTETETVEVPVSHEEVRLEREPISAEEAARLKGTEQIGEEEVEMVLHEERVNVTKDTVPVEKISMSKETVEGTRTVEGEVRKERFETDVDVDKDHR